jgi:acylphosphatase
MFNAFTGIIRGRVQGVGFRYFAKNKAEELHLTGWVRNLPDGTVEVLAVGPVPALEQFMQRLKVGPMGSRVEGTQFQWLEESQAFTRFEIRG